MFVSRLLADREPVLSEDSTCLHASMSKSLLADLLLSLPGKVEDTVVYTGVLAVELVE